MVEERAKQGPFRPPVPPRRHVKTGAPISACGKRMRWYRVFHWSRSVASGRIEDRPVPCIRRNTRPFQEEGEYENVAYHPSKEAERDASFGPGPIMGAVAARESQMGEAGEGSGEESQSGRAPAIKCSGGAGSESEFTVGLGAGRREYVVANQCPAQKSYPRGRKWGHIKAIRGTGGHNWRDVSGAYCGVVGAQALIPGVDIFDAPAGVGCAGYGLFRATEIVVG